MFSKKSLVGAVFGAAVMGTRVGRELAGKVVGQVRRQLGMGGGSDPFAVVPPDPATLSDGERQDLAALLPPTPGTVAVAVGAPNAPDLDVIAGDHDDGKHQPKK